MKLKRILTEINSTITDFGDIKPTKTVEDMIQNLFSIAGDNSNRKMMQLKAYDYLMENQAVAKEFLSKFGLKTKEDFFSYMVGVHNKARVIVNKNKAEFRKYWDDIGKTNANVDSIESMALLAAAELERELAGI